MPKTYEGRLVTDGEGNLYAQPLDDDGNSLPIHYEDDSLVSGLIAVAFDPDTHGYIVVEPGAQSHNDRFHEQHKEISGTSGPLYELRNGEMVEVYPGDPHHEGPLPDDVHFSVDAPRNTIVQFSPDDVAITETSHTEAYREQ